MTNSSPARFASVDTIGTALGLGLLFAGFIWCALLTGYGAERLLLTKAAYHASIALDIITIGLGLYSSLRCAYPANRARNLELLGIGVTVFGGVLLAGTVLIRIGVLPLAY